MRYLRIALFVVCVLLPGGTLLYALGLWWLRHRENKRALAARREYIIASIKAECLTPHCDPEKDTVRLVYPERSPLTTVQHG